MASEKDYTKYSFLLTGLVVLMLICVSFIPPVRVGNTVVKRANILSDIFPVEDEITPPPCPESLLDTSFLVGFEFPAGEEAPSSGNAYPEGGPETAAGTIGTDDVPSGGGPEGTPGPEAEAAEEGEDAEEGMTCAAVENPDLVAIEDFSPGGEMMNRFYNALAYESDERVVRIAVLGDSFIESDIITADMREQLQERYGGSGVGFVPFTTPLSKYRGTVRHTFSNWDYYNIMQKKSVPEEYQDKFFISGMLSVPKKGASVQYEGVKFRRRIETANTATMIFANRGGSVIDVTLNDSVRKTYTPPRHDSLISHITIRDGAISKLGISVGEPEGFIGYGVVLEDSVGVSVHNYSVRSNSGLAIFGTDAGVNRQIGGLMDYDLIILQYGLNVMSNDVFDYGYYERHLTRIVEYVKQCFPGSAILIMSVGDRSTLKSGTAVTMPEVRAMIDTQRGAAEKSGVGFWNTLEGMGGENSMAEFVRNKWASKDHTHINYSGGKQIAGQLVSYINAAVESIIAQDAARHERKAAEEAEKARRLEESGGIFADSVARAILQRAGNIFGDGQETDHE